MASVFRIEIRVRYTVFLSRDLKDKREFWVKEEWDGKIRADCLVFQLHGNIVLCISKLYELVDYEIPCTTFKVAFLPLSKIPTNFTARLGSLHETINGEVFQSQDNISAKHSHNLYSEIIRLLIAQT